jgi:hypothetical protein
MVQENNLGGGNYPRFGGLRNLRIIYLLCQPTWKLRRPDSMLPLPAGATANLSTIFFTKIWLPIKSRSRSDQKILVLQPETPTFLLIGELLSEETRRKLRLLSIERPLFFIEVNNAPNHLSLAREAKLVQRVIRMLTPAIFAPRLQALSTIFIAGNADFMNVIENVHFGLKGTPSASEVEFLTYLLEQNQPTYRRTSTAGSKSHPLRFGSGTAAESSLPQLAEHVEQHLARVLSDHAHRLDVFLDVQEERTAARILRIQRAWKKGIIDEFAGVEPLELLDLLAQNVDDQIWGQALQRSFLSVFGRHQPQYLPEACSITSGSSAPRWVSWVFIAASRKW